jgi:hypothetical protein
MANTFELIASSTVGSGGAANIDFTSIPATFTDLCLKYSTRSTSAGDDYLGQYIKFNTATSPFTYRHLYGTGSAAGSGNGSTNLGSYTQGGLTTANTFTNGEIYIPNYAGSNNKSFSSDSTVENNATLGFADLLAGLWSNTSAINAISIYPQSGNFAEHSTAYLYGVSNA